MNATKLLIIIPPYSQWGRGKYVMPLGTLYVSAALKKSGVQTETLNMNHHTWEECAALIERERINVIALGGLSGEFRVIYDFIALVKRRYPTMTIVVGGGLVTAAPIVAMRALKFADVGIVGEGEETMRELLEALNGHSDLKSVKGLVLKSSTDVFFETGARADIRNLDDLPLPDYDGFEFGTYLETNSMGLGYKKEPLSPVNIVGSRSCPYRCTFCFHPSGKHYRVRSMKSIFGEIDYLLSRHPAINHIAMREELFASDPRRIREFTELISGYNLYWSIQLRVDNIREETLSRLHDSNCYAVFLGTESLDDDILTSMNKRISAAEIKGALKLAEAQGVPIRTGLIFGDKAETENSYRKTLEWYYEQNSYSEVLERPMITVDMLIPFPGSSIYRYACEKGIIEDEEEYLRLGCPIVNLTSMNEDTFLEMMSEIQRINGRSYFYLNKDGCRRIDPPR